jgi:hypothetical protein
MAAETAILPKGCVCGHDHETHRGEHVERCLECNCDEQLWRCQNCGDPLPTWPLHRATFHACSRKCLLQLEHAEQLRSAA